jgi:uncharacterized protein (DUF2384 family)
MDYLNVANVRRSFAWLPDADTIVFRESADTLEDLTPLLCRIVDALGTNAAARLLGADRSQVSRWHTGSEGISAEMGRRMVDLLFVLTRLFRVLSREAAAMWLGGSEPLLGGARPIDVLAAEGASRVIRAIDGIEQGAFA